MHRTRIPKTDQPALQCVRIDRATKWGNPFVIGKHGTRAEVIQMYAEWIRTQRHLMADLESLRGKTLLCWCHPLPCHGDILIQLLDEITDDKDLG